MSDTTEDLLLRRSKRIFAVDRRNWNAACNLGMNEAVCYLVIASGTGGDQRTSSWSATAIEKYMGIHHRRATTAIQRLEAEKLVAVVKNGSFRRYSLQPACAVPSVIKRATAGQRRTPAQQQEIVERLLLPEWIWLPNSLIQGAADETSPVKLLRQSQNLNALRLFINFYYHHDLTADHGIDWRIRSGVREEYTRKEIGHHGNHKIWAFKPLQYNVSTITDFYFDEFWDCFHLLKEAGLIEFVAHLVEGDSDDAEIIHPLPYPDTGETGEQEITKQAIGAARLMAPYFKDKSTMLAPVLSRLANVQMVGIARLKYRPQTTKTAEWLSNAAEWKKYASGYEAMAAQIEDSGIKVASR